MTNGPCNRPLGGVAGEGWKKATPPEKEDRMAYVEGEDKAAGNAGRNTCATPADPRIKGLYSNQLSQNWPDIGWAIRQMRHGLKVRRGAWRSMGIWLAIQNLDSLSTSDLPYVYVNTSIGERLPWTCSQSDLLSWDWEIATID